MRKLYYHSLPSLSIKNAERAREKFFESYRSKGWGRGRKLSNLAGQRETGSARRGKMLEASSEKDVKIQKEGGEVFDICNGKNPLKHLYFLAKRNNGSNPVERRRTKILPKSSF